jgi:hypothetical protein
MRKRPKYIKNIPSFSPSSQNGRVGEWNIYKSSLGQVAWQLWEEEEEANGGTEMSPSMKLHCDENSIYEQSFQLLIIGVVMQILPTWPIFLTNNEARPVLSIIQKLTCEILICLSCYNLINECLRFRAFKKMRIIGWELVIYGRVPQTISHLLPLLNV